MDFFFNNINRISLLGMLPATPWIRESAHTLKIRIAKYIQIHKDFSFADTHRRRFNLLLCGVGVIRKRNEKNSRWLATGTLPVCYGRAEKLSACRSHGVWRTNGNRAGRSSAARLLNKTHTDTSSCVHSCKGSQTFWSSPSTVVIMTKYRKYFTWHFIKTIASSQFVLRT